MLGDVEKACCRCCSPRTDESVKARALEGVAIVLPSSCRDVTDSERVLPWVPTRWRWLTSPPLDGGEAPCSAEECLADFVLRVLLLGVRLKPDPYVELPASIMADCNTTASKPIPCLIAKAFAIEDGSDLLETSPIVPAHDGVAE